MKQLGWGQFYEVGRDLDEQVELTFKGAIVGRFTPEGRPACDHFELLRTKDIEIESLREQLIEALRKIENLERYGAPNPGYSSRFDQRTGRAAGWERFGEPHAAPKPGAKR